jgi:hypothetical protein
MIDKCWKMIDGAPSKDRVAKIATVAASFYAIPSEKGPLRTSGHGKMDDNALGSCLGEMIQGIVDFLRTRNG